MIYHAIRDRKDPHWEGWSVERIDRPSGKFALTLREIRQGYGAKLHAGAHPDPSERPVGVRNCTDDEGHPFPGWSVYWFEMED